MRLTFRGLSLPSNQEVLRDLTYLHVGRVTYLFHQTDLEKKNNVTRRESRRDGVGRI